MGVVNASVDNTDFDSLARVLEHLVDIVDAGHGVGAIQLLGGWGLVLQDLGLASGNDLDRPDAFDTGDRGQVLALVAKLDVVGGAVENMELSANFVVDIAGVERVAGLEVVDAVLVLDYIGTLDNVGGLLGERDELACRNQRDGGSQGNEGGNFHCSCRGRRGRLVIIKEWVRG